MSKPLNISISTENLIPHKEKIKYIYYFTPRTENSSESLITVKDSMFLNKDNTLSNMVIPELFSQVYAAHLEYFDKLNRGPDNLGLLVSIKNLNFKGNALLGDTIKISVAMENEIQAFQIVSGSVYKNNNEIANCTFKIWIPESDSQIKKETNKPVCKRPDFDSPVFLSYCENTVQEDIVKSICSDNDKGFVLYFNNDFSGFSGHFPDYSILPGAVILEAGKILTELKFKRKIKILRIDNVKFSNIIVPGQDIIFNIFKENNKIVIHTINKNVTCSNILMEIV